MKEFLESIELEHLIFLFSLVFITTFRKPISALIPRIKSLSKDGLIAGSSPEIQLENKNPGAVKELLGYIDKSIVISDLEERIEQDLISRKLNADSDTAKVLIRHLAGTQLLLTFEQVHSLIFGSQIFLLRRLNEVAGQGRNLDFVNQHIEHVKNMYDKELGTWSNDQYLGYLYNNQLIIMQSHQLHITNLGAEFLIWIARVGKSDNNQL